MQKQSIWGMLAPMKYTLECEREDDGRFLAEVPELPGVLAYGKTADEATAKAEALALRVLADQLDHSEAKAHNISFSVLVPA
jgi:predicted RNase H-like HicB family nuclease